MSETIFQVQADQLLVDGDTAILVVESVMEVCDSCNGSGIGRSGDVSSQCDSCNGGGIDVPPPELVALNRPCDQCGNCPCPHPPHLVVDPTCLVHGSEPCDVCWNGREPFTLQWPCLACNGSGAQLITYPDFDAIDCVAECDDGVVSLRVAFRGDLPQLVPIMWWDMNKPPEAYPPSNGPCVLYDTGDGQSAWWLWHNGAITSVSCSPAAVPGMFAAFLDVEPTP